MCLAALAIDAHHDWPLIIVANRDEFHARPTQMMQPWIDEPAILGGRDLQAGGTWLGIDHRGRLALLTNVRDPKNNKPHAPSRGQLAEKFLRGENQAQDYLRVLAQDAQRYNGFNLVVIENGLGWHASNYQDPFFVPLEPGVHGLSNALMDTPWPKTQRTSSALANHLFAKAPIDPVALSEIMLDTTAVSDDALPNTGISLARERLLSTPFIVSPDYGTRCTTIVLRHRTGAIWVQEDNYDRSGVCVERSRWLLVVNQGWQSTQIEPGSLNTD